MNKQNINQEENSYSNLQNEKNYFDTDEFNINDQQEIDMTNSPSKYTINKKQKYEFTNDFQESQESENMKKFSQFRFATPFPVSPRLTGPNELNIDDHGLLNINESFIEEKINNYQKISLNQREILENLELNNNSNNFAEKNTDNKIPYKKRLDLHDFIESSQITIADYICSLCQGVYWEPIVDGCGHVFCKECFNSFIEISKKPICPILHQEIDISVVAPIKFVSSILERQILKCKNCPCNWIGKLQDLTTHLNIECEWEFVKCAFRNCPTRQERKNINQHEESCEYKPISCALCYERIIFKDKPVHALICRKEKLPCPKQCGSMVERDLIDFHVIEVCPLTEVECQYVDFGCVKKIAKKDLKNHLIEEVSFHNLNVCKFLLSFKNNLLNRVEKIENTLLDNNEKYDSFYEFIEKDLKNLNNIIMLNNSQNSMRPYLPYQSRRMQKIEKIDLTSHPFFENSNQTIGHLINGMESGNDNMPYLSKKRKRSSQNFNEITKRKRHSQEDLLREKLDVDDDRNFSRDELKRSNSFERDENEEQDQKNNTNLELEDIPFQPFEVDYISEGIKQEKEKTFVVISEKKKHKFILAKNKIFPGKSFSWIVKINRISGWMAFGLADKEKISNNQYKFNGVTNLPHGCFLLSSNKFIWNNNIISQNNLYLSNIHCFKNGDEIRFTYCPDDNTLKFKMNSEDEGTLKKIFSSQDKSLVPCFVLINKNDEITIEF